eukprot:4147504-Pleurochrysis_carterae.AAC.1
MDRSPHGVQHIQETRKAPFQRVSSSTGAAKITYKLRLILQSCIVNQGYCISKNVKSAYTHADRSELHDLKVASPAAGST